MNPSLYALTVLLWGTSWIAVKFQLGVVPAEVSVVYRFLIAAGVMLAFCLVARKPMRFSLRDHAFMAFQGFCLFCTNYFFIYLGTQYLTTGLVAVLFSTVVVMNIIGTALIFGERIRPAMVAGAALGMSGIALVFWPELEVFDLESDGLKGIGLALIGTAFASVGMLTSAWVQRRRALPVIQTNAYGMAYGALSITLMTLALGSPFTFDPAPRYVLSLLYLAVGGTVIGFWSYLTLVGRIGADRAAYVAVIFPIVALAISTWFEAFQWSASSALGIVLVLCGNVLILIKPKARAKPAAPEPPRQSQRCEVTVK
ncbi:MAG: DMT family transporter [Pseudomonadota bacterium]